MIPGITPAIRKKPTPDPGGGYSFTMTAGDYLGVLQGYSDGTDLPAWGGINAEPIPGHNLAFFLSGAGSQIGFHGDCLALLAGKSVWVGGVEYPFDGVDWSSDGTYTGGSWDSAGPTFVDQGVYFVEIK